MLPIKQRLDNDDHYDGGNTKEYVVVHDTGNLTDSDEGNANYFCTGKRNASAHYFVDDDSITQVVLDDDCSFHCGDGYNAYGIGNRNSIGIEQCRVNGVVTPTTEANTVELVKYLMSKYNVSIDKVVRHYDASRKNCPASFNLDGKWTRWFEFKAKLIKQSQPISQSSGEIFRVRKSWDDVISQIGAYSILDNAKDCVDKNNGYFVFNGNGVTIYPISQVETPISQPNLQPQDNSNDLTIQQKLRRLQIPDDNGNQIACDGKIGTKSKQAIRRFESLCGLSVDEGIWGSQCETAYQEIISKPYCDRNNQTNKYAVRYIQWLTGASPIDGAWGNISDRCVYNWQSKNNLVADKKFGNNSWTKAIG